jgi:hypothetical protein
MRKPFAIILGFYLLAGPLSARAQAQNARYVYDGKILQAVDEDFAPAKYTQWQIWLYQQGVRIPRYTVGMQYSRWGLIEGTSAENVMKQLRALQSFEAAYLRFFGPDEWGRYTFFNPVGPIAISDPLFEEQSAALEKLYQLRWLQERVNTLVRAATPSLENNQRLGTPSPVEGYFDQIRDALQRVSKLHSQLSHPSPHLRFIESGIIQAKIQVGQAETNVPKITAFLPTVKLPTTKTWMSYSEAAGRDGTIQVEVVETGSGVSVQKTWTGGDGAMTGTVIVTWIPYTNIGKIDLGPPVGTGDHTWTVHVESANTPFLQKFDSPKRRTASRTLPEIHDATTYSYAYFEFANSGDAHDAYAYFLYHKQLGR